MGEAADRMVAIRSVISKSIDAANRCGIINSLAPVAQWTEYLTSNQLVGRSSRPGGASYLKGE